MPVLSFMDELSRMRLFWILDNNNPECFDPQSPGFYIDPAGGWIIYFILFYFILF